MEIPDKVKDAVLTSMADYYLEESPPFESELDVEPEVKQKSKDKPARIFKINPVILNTVTALFSKEGKYRALVQTVFDDETGGYCFRVNTTKKTFTSHRLAINNAKRWLKKKRMKYYKKHPKERPRIKTVRIHSKEKPIQIKSIQKLYKMKLETAKILIRMSEKKLKIHKEYARKKFNSKKTTAVSGNTKDFNIAIYTVMVDGTKNERKLVAKMLKKFTHEEISGKNMFY